MKPSRDNNGIENEVEKFVVLGIIGVVATIGFATVKIFAATKYFWQSIFH